MRLSSVQYDKSVLIIIIAFLLLILSEQRSTALGDMTGSTDLAKEGEVLDQQLCPSDSSYKLSEGIEISAQDERGYRTLSLPNELQILLISDPETDKASAALDVGVGSLCDPAEVPGLAHFLEHMLFLGTEKYPEENSYGQFISAHGGRSNAYTALENTNYYFDITPPFLHEALDRFSQFFTAPLFTASATEREMNAVDAEHSKNLQNDQWRMMQLYRSLAREDHPLNRFATGNLQTLSETPKKQGVDVRESLLRFHRTYYSANIMKLAVIGRESLDTLEGWVRELFSSVKNFNVSRPMFPGNPFSARQLRRETLLEPVKDLRMLEVIWPLQPLQKRYLEKASHYVSHLMGHEGPGSILALLRNKNWANELSAGVNKEQSDFTVFAISIELTTEGLDHVDEIVHTVYEYVGLLRRFGPLQWVYQESANVAAMNFRFKSKEEPYNYATHLASNMQLYPSRHIVSGPRLLRKFDPSLIQDVLNRLHPDNMRLLVVSKSYSTVCTSTEEWYGTRYLDKAIASTRLDRWKGALEGPESNLQLPAPNEFIATDFSLRFPTLEPQKRATVALESPKLVKEDSFGKVWYKYDGVFQKPKLNVLMTLISPATYFSPADAALTDVFIRCINDKLSDFAYYAEVASLKYRLSQTIGTIDLYVMGYNHKLPVLLKRILEVIKTGQISEELFQRMKDKAKRSYRNFKQEQPYQHAIYHTTYMLEQLRWHHDDKLIALEELSLSDLEALRKRVFSQLYTEFLLHGNVEKEAALSIVEESRQVLGYRPLSKAQREQARVVRLSSGTKYLYSSNPLNPEDPNSAIEVLFQVGPENLRQSSLVSLLAHLLKEPFYDKLRTKEQLGYLVFSSSYFLHGIDYLRFIIQSDKYDASYLDQRIELFLLAFRDILMEMSEEEFEKNRDAVIAKKLEKDKNLWQESVRYWNEITTHSYVFDRTRREGHFLKTVRKGEILSLFEAFLVPSSPTVAKLSSLISTALQQRVAAPLVKSSGEACALALGLELANGGRDGHCSNGTRSSGLEVQVIRDMDDFKRSMPLFPVLSAPATSSRL